MGEEEKKPEEKKMEEKKPEEVKKPEEKKKTEEKKEEKPAEEKKEEKKSEEGKDGKDAKEGDAPPPPPPPQEIVLRVYMHCEGCARKVKRCLKGFEGVEDVSTDCKSHKVVVKGEKADPIKVLERVQRKSHRQVELLSPIPKPPAEEEKKPEEKPKPEEKKEEPPQVITVVLKVHMHCEACAQEIKKRIQRMKGVESAEPDLKSSQVTVKGVFDPTKLVEYVHKRTGKHAEIVKQEPEKKADKEKAKEVSKDEKKGGEEGDKDKKSGGDGGEAAPAEDNKEKKGDGKEAAASVAPEGGAVTEETKVVELMSRNEFNCYPPRYAMELHAYPPQIFSDENPNACSVM
ncbi:heavy metal-associated isoprenylated plant protein 7 [Argentina anserina]|uniref:heavy metal-associated isoprenylated plant protein 7 n=1 Tax=Argentina anserina TaxID=57926 RepID=UPI0021761FA0|nr:heavy metal-associated isoprenylated plant protein 7 [Potentilla anserina]